MICSCRSKSLDWKRIFEKLEKQNCSNFSKHNNSENPYVPHLNLHKILEIYSCQNWYFLYIYTTVYNVLLYRRSIGLKKHCVCNLTSIIWQLSNFFMIRTLKSVPVKNRPLKNPLHVPPTREYWWMNFSSIAITLF